MNNNYILILAGGKGTRFWPKSRQNYPKQFLSLESDRSFLQLTYDRLIKLVPKENIYIVTAGSQKELIEQQLPEIKNEQIIVEPMGRNTCPAISLGVSYIQHRDQNAVVMVTPSDHLIEDEEAFIASAASSMEYANKNNTFVLFGIKPVTPHTGYGYIKVKEQSKSGFIEVDSFVEKPDKATAENYLLQGGYYWNSGMFVFTARTYFEELKRLHPVMYDQFQQIKAAISTPGEQQVIDTIYPKTQEISIDYAVMEKAGSVTLSALDVGWNDAGSWSSLYDILPRDTLGNHFKNKDSVAFDTANVIGFTDKMLAVLGLEDVVVVETEDTILLCHREKAQNIKQILDELRKRGKEDYL